MNHSDCKKIIETMLIIGMLILYICLIAITSYGIINSDTIFDYIFYSIFLFAILIPIILIGGAKIINCYLVVVQLIKSKKRVRKNKHNGELLQMHVKEKYIAKLIMEYVGYDEDNESGIQVIIS